MTMIIKNIICILISIYDIIIIKTIRRVRKIGKVERDGMRIKKEYKKGKKR